METTTGRYTEYSVYGKLEQRILEMPVKIANHSRLIMERAIEIELERKEIEQLKAKYLEPILNNKDLSNQAKRDIALEKSLSEDANYKSKLLTLTTKEKVQKESQITLEYHHNTFKALLAIAGMGK